MGLKIVFFCILARQQKMLVFKSLKPLVWNSTYTNSTRISWGIISLLLVNFVLLSQIYLEQEIEELQDKLCIQVLF